MAEAYTPQSRLLAQLLSQRKNPVQSIGQGLADMAGDIGAAYYLKKDQDRADEKEKDRARVMAEIFATAANPNLTNLQAATAQGMAPEARQAFPGGMTSAAEMMAGAAPNRAQTAFAPEMMQTASPEARKLAAYMQGMRQDPAAAMAALPNIEAVAGMFEKPQSRYQNVEGVGLVEIPGRGGKPSVAIGVPAPRDPNAPLSEARLAQELKLRQASQTPKEQWTPLTPDQVRASNLDPSGTYQRNSAGQIQVITQPKQANPTETQSKYAFNAGRVADSLGKVAEVLKKDPSAVTSWWLQATDNSILPGAETIARATVNPNAQLVRNNLTDAVDAILTLGTGAAYTQEQLAAARNAYLPQAGEPEEVKADKFRKTTALYSQAKENARAAGVDLPDAKIFNDIYGVKSDRPADAPEDAKQAPNGKWYSPDPLRPGKFVEW